MFVRVRNVITGSIVLFLRNKSHAVSSSESDEAGRTTGRFEGQSTFPGAHPLLGESGAPRLVAPKSRGIAALFSAEAAQSVMIPTSKSMLAKC